MNRRPWTVVLVDDDESFRHSLRQALQGREEFRVVEEAANGPDAVALLDRLRPDLALLDVEMPGFDGLDVLRSLRPGTWPLVIFLTGHRRLVVDAFEPNGIDSLLKPFDPERVGQALDRAVLRLREPDPQMRRRLEKVLAQIRPRETIDRLPIRRGGKVEIVDLDDVDWVGAAGNYVELHAGGRRYLHRSPLSHFSQRLDPQRFVRIHRSTVVNVERVRSMTPTPQGDYRLKLEDGQELRLSRRFREALQRLTSTA